MRLHSIIQLMVLSLSLGLAQTIVGQNSGDLRDPEFLVEQYNKLVAKHNALIKKTTTIIEQQKTSQSSTSDDPSISKKLNDAISQIVELEGQLSILKQGKVRPNAGNIYLEETNARLQRQLQELKADEQELAQLVSELTNENRD